MFRNNSVEAGGAMPPASISKELEANPPQVRVWDAFVRVSHWSVVALFGIAFATGNEIEWLHLAAGYTIAGLIVLRIVWGFIGPRHARFSDFVRPPRETMSYLRDIPRGRARRHLGHNPAGGVMVMALILMLVGISVSGFMMTTDAFWGA